MNDSSILKQALLGLCDGINYGIPIWDVIVNASISMMSSNRLDSASGSQNLWPKILIKLQVFECLEVF